VLIVDIDRFKSVNDTWGHAAGDKAIVSTAKAIAAAVRASDSVYRYGGEEFVVVAPGASGASLRALGERVRRMVEKAVVDIGGRELRITVSVGTAAQVSDPAGREPATVFKAADGALYVAKRSGRNRVEQGPEL
jgi:diguanylate cyclase (GGDEF)-like protein